MHTWTQAPGWARAWVRLRTRAHRTVVHTRARGYSCAHTPGPSHASTAAHAGTRTHVHNHTRAPAHALRTARAQPGLPVGACTPQRVHSSVCAQPHACARARRSSRVNPCVCTPAATCRERVGNGGCLRLERARGRDRDRMGAGWGRGRGRGRGQGGGGDPSVPPLSPPVPRPPEAGAGGAHLPSAEALQHR